MRISGHTLNSFLSNSFKRHLDCVCVFVGKKFIYQQILLAFIYGKTESLKYRISLTFSQMHGEEEEEEENNNNNINTQYLLIQY